MIWLDAAAAVFAVLFFAAAWESKHRPARPSFQPLCPCPKQCGRPAGQHVEPYAALLPSPVIRIPGPRRPQ